MIKEILLALNGTRCGGNAGDPGRSQGLYAAVDPSESVAPWLLILFGGNGGSAPIRLLKSDLKEKGPQITTYPKLDNHEISRHAMLKSIPTSGMFRTACLFLL